MTLMSCETCLPLRVITWYMAKHYSSKYWHVIVFFSGQLTIPNLKSSKDEKT